MLIRLYIYDEGNLPRKGRENEHWKKSVCNFLLQKLKKMCKCGIFIHINKAALKKFRGNKLYKTLKDMSNALMIRENERSI